MTPDDATPDTGTLSRRALRARTGPVHSVLPPSLPSDDTELPSGDTDFGAQWADRARPATALTWIDADDVKESTRPADLDAAATEDNEPSLFADARFRPALVHGRWLFPLGTLAALVIGYSATMLLWPLHEIAPTVQAIEFDTAPSVAAAPTWPTTGSAGVGVAGISSMASTPDAASIASLTKVVTSLMVLDQMPLQPGEQGPEFSFTYSDSVNYWDYRRADQSALDVPVGGVLTEYQMLQGTLLGSANNYVDRLARDLWGSDAQFADAAATWLASRGLTGITIVTPSGFSEGNVATPEALLRLAERAMQNPVFAEIVGTTSVELPGAGLVTNTNGMLADPGVLGIKTGTLVGSSLLTAKDVTLADGTVVRLYSSVLNQSTGGERLAVTRSLLAGVEAELNTVSPAVPAGTLVGEVSTQWGEQADVVVDDDASVVLWNGAAATPSVRFDFDDQRADGDAVGALNVSGPLDAVTVEVTLASDIAGPSPWWRLTHPLELLGITVAN